MKLFQTHSLTHQDNNNAITSALDTSNTQAIAFTIIKQSIAFLGTANSTSEWLRHFSISPVTNAALFHHSRDWYHQVSIK
jgi:hypothetical protein